MLFCIVLYLYVDSVPTAITEGWRFASICVVYFYTCVCTDFYCYDLIWVGWGLFQGCQTCDENLPHPAIRSHKPTLQPHACSNCFSKLLQRSIKMTRKLPDVYVWEFKHSCEILCVSMYLHKKGRGRWRLAVPPCRRCRRSVWRASRRTSCASQKNALH